ncbi:MAG: hypothetical protein HKN26_00650 [Acidimicrobiales bacterium]|nr:hypothetical protein [Acidimicrobiales bacterium]
MHSRAARLAAVLFALALLAASCGSNDGTSSAEPDATNDAAEPAPAGPEADDTTPVDSASATTEPADVAVSFTTDVQPILEGSCVSCHVPGGPGAVHMELETIADAAKDAAGIGLVTGTGYMPPWPASDLSIPFHDDRSLTDDQIATLAEWVADGAPLDAPDDTPLVAAAEIAPPLDADMVLTGPEPYQGSTDTLDDYRCQIYDPELTEPQWLKGAEFRPDQTTVVHHSVLFLARADARPAADALNYQDGQPGWQCYGLAGLDAFQMGGWAPGQAAREYPDGIGILMQPGDFFINQVHYHYEEDAPADNSGTAFAFASLEDAEAAGGFRELTSHRYLTPAEIPCAEWEEGPLCDREASLEAAIEQFGPFARTIANGLTAACGYTPEDFAHMTDGTASSTCDKNITNPGQIVAVTGHMHEIGSAYRLTLNPDTPDERILLDIPNWSFEWQLVYGPTEDIVVTADDVVRVECWWDRAKIDPDLEPRYVLWAEGTNDEMCYTAISTVPVE